jgi:predicted RecB family nuclease
MQKRIDVIVQGAFTNGSWRGIADILIKVPGKSKLGDWSYEVQDTKLAQDTRAATILQLCLYADLLSHVQEATPEKMYVVKPGPDFATEAYRFAEFQAYYRLVKKNFEHIMTFDAQPTYPDPVEHCNICRSLVYLPQIFAHQNQPAWHASGYGG